MSLTRVLLLVFVCALTMIRAHEYDVLSEPFPTDGFSDQYAPPVFKALPSDALASMVTLNFTGTLTDATQKILSALSTSPPMLRGVYGRVTSDDGMAANQTMWHKTVATLKYLSRSGAAVASPVKDLYFAANFIHGANYVRGATLFPHQIGLAASFDTDLVARVGLATAVEAAFSGVDIVFSPSLDVAVNAKWPGTYETFGEDSFLVERLGRSMIDAMQREINTTLFEQPASPDVVHLVGCVARHFILSGASRSGFNGAPAWMTFHTMLNYFAAPFRNLSSVGVMTANIENEGRPSLRSPGNDALLRQFLKYNGTLFSSEDEVPDLVLKHRTTDRNSSAVFDAVTYTTLDTMLLSYDYGPTVSSSLQTMVQRFMLPADRVFNSTRRFENMSRSVGFDEMVQPKVDWDTVVAQHASVALEAARRSITLLKNTNNNVLPIRSGGATNTTTIVLVGYACNSTAMLSGGHTNTPEGTLHDESYFTSPNSETLFSQLSAAFSSTSNKVLFFPAWDGTDEVRIVTPWETIRSALMSITNPLVITCLGESPYTKHSGDITDIALPKLQRQFVKNISTIVSPERFVGVLVEGRPRVLTDAVESTLGAIVLAWLPGPSGAAALRDVLLGTVSPSGRLPITYPRSRNQVPTYHYVLRNQHYNPLYPFGHGLTYANITIKDFNVVYNIERTVFEAHVTVCSTPFTATSTGGGGGNGALPSFSLLLFAREGVRPMVPERQKLADFVVIDGLDSSNSNNCVDVRFNDVDLSRFMYYDEHNCEYVTIRHGVEWYVMGYGSQSDIVRTDDVIVRDAHGPCFLSGVLNDGGFEWYFRQPEQIENNDVIFLTLTSFSLGFGAAWIIIMIARKTHIVQLL